MPTFDTRAPISAVVALIMGEVRISAGERATTIVAVNPSDANDAEDVQAAQLTRVEYGEGRLLVKAPRPRSWLGRKGGSVDVAIELPAGSDLIGHAASGDFQGDGRLGDCRIKLGLGQVQLDEVATLSVKSGAGDVSVRRVTLRAEVGDRDRRHPRRGARRRGRDQELQRRHLGRHGARRPARTVGERQPRRRHRARGVSAKSANGDIRLGDVAGGSVAVETHAGDLEVGIRAGTAAWLDLDAGAGRVHNGLEAAERPESEADTVEVRARTAIGDIVVQRA